MTCAETLPWGYSLELEILCSIPLAGRAAVASLAEDFGRPEKKIRRVIDRLIAQGYRLTYSTTKAFVAVAYDGKQAVEAATSEYWERVYGNAEKRRGDAGTG